MSKPLGNQSSATRLFAVLTSVFLAIASILAGPSVLFHEQLFADFDVELPALTLTAFRLGITPVVLCWLGYMAALVFLLGYQSRDWRNIFVWAAFCIAAIYVVGTVLATLLPYTKISFIA